MASVGRVVVIAPQSTPSAAIFTAGQPLTCILSAHPILTFPTQVENVLVHCARPKNQIRSLAVTTDRRQQANAFSCKSLGEQATKLSSTMVALAASALVGATCGNVAEASAVESLGLEAGAVFERTCAGCHSGGGNILQPAATLFKEDLDKNGAITVDDIYNITYFGKNRMPGYGEKCTPRGQCTFGPRLSEEDIRALAEFVKLRADQGWPK